MKTLQEKYDELRVSFEDALYRYNKDERVAVTLAFKECRLFFTQLLQLRKKIEGA